MKFESNKVTWTQFQVHEAAAQLDEPERSKFLQRIEEFERIKQMIGRSFRGNSEVVSDLEFTKSMIAMLPKWFPGTARFMESLKGRKDVPG